MSQYVIVDLEMCRVQDKEKRKEFCSGTELIQIGAILVNENYEIADEFVTHVKPVFGVVDPFIEQLTGISQKDVENAPESEQALEMFVRWLPEDAIIVSWSESDRNQIINELDGKNLGVEEIDPFLESWIDCQPTFSEKMKTDRIYKLSEALNIADIYYDDGEHDALVDARNTAKLFIKMQKEPELILSNGYAREEKDAPINSAFASLLSGLDFGDGEEE